MTYVPQMDLVQDAATDCSVVASLCAGAERVRRGHTPLLKTIMWPWDDDKNEPHLSENGKYIFRLNFNGCFRKVVIDDRIPTSATDRVIHVLDRNNPALLWPALIEKAYLKVRGGYDFPGSNSGTDLWILTGWIPEQIFLQAEDLEPRRFWQRMLAAFTRGDIMITIGTGKMSLTTEKALGLASEHDYAVLDLREVEGQHLMLIKNPWLSGMAWSGRHSSAADVDTDPVSSPRDLLNKDHELKPGTFWMDLDNVLQYFESIYLNWSPGLFSFRQDVHFEWDLTELDVHGARKPRGAFASLQNHKQYVVSVQRPGSIWLLLWRHFQNTVPEGATPDEIESGKHFIDLNGHMTLASFDAGGRRVMLPERHHQKGWFVDSPQTLLLLEDCEAEKPYTIAALEQNLPATKHTFTISAFSTSPLTIANAAPRYAHSTLLSAAWTYDTAGGHSQAATYCSNPQFLLGIAGTTTFYIHLFPMFHAVDRHVNRATGFPAMGKMKFEHVVSASLPGIGLPKGHQSKVAETCALIPHANQPIAHTRHHPASLY
jgi:calpain-7